jgi:hypothetical protein
VRLRYALPLAQTALAVALISQSRRELAAAHIHAGTVPAYSLLVLINPPPVMLRSLWFDHVDNVWSNDGLFVASIGLFWYLVGLSIDFYQKSKTKFPLPLRIPADLVFIALGPYFIWLFRRVDVAHMLWRWKGPALVCVFCWLLGPAFIFGRDLIHCLRCKGSPPASPPRTAEINDANTSGG